MVMKGKWLPVVSGIAAAAPDALSAWAVCADSDGKRSKEQIATATTTATTVVKRAVDRRRDRGDRGSFSGEASIDAPLLSCLRSTPRAL